MKRRTIIVFAFLILTAFLSYRFFTAPPVSPPPKDNTISPSTSMPEGDGIVMCAVGLMVYCVRKVRR